MAVQIIMPKAGMSMEEGTLIRWLINTGDAVKKGEPVMEIETDKVTMEVEADADGFLLGKLYHDGDVVPVTMAVGYIGEKGENMPQAETTKAAPPEAAETQQAGQQAPPVTFTNTDTGDVRATPHAKKIAAERGIDLKDAAPSGKSGEVRGRDVESFARITPLARAIAESAGIDAAHIQGSGYAGKILRSDVEAATMHSAAPERRKQPGMRRAIADKMIQAHKLIPPVTQTMKIDVSALLESREKLNRNGGTRYTINDFILKATAVALTRHPGMMASIEGDVVTTYHSVHLGMAVALDDGLIVPVIRDAQELTLSGISARARDLAECAKKGALNPDETRGSTFTVTNMGMFGIETFTPIINTPEAAILGIGCVDDELTLDGGQVKSRKVMRISVTFDHRIMDGAGPARFMLTLRQLLENPLEMFV
jgi:pyruvate dehydrogenase E2 component (dihydrolipoamide acetyltransferase)